jgi:hypothetical protein
MPVKQTAETAPRAIWIHVSYMGYRKLRRLADGLPEVPLVSDKARPGLTRKQHPDEVATRLLAWALDNAPAEVPS